MHRLALPCLVLVACGLLPTSNNLKVPYKLQAQEYKLDASAAFGAAGGSKLPSVDCSRLPSACSSIGGLPSGATAACVSGTCVVAYDLRLVLPVNLSSQTGFPAAVANAPGIDDVQVDSLAYWAAMNSLNSDTPPIDLYVGPATAMTEAAAGASKLGTLPAIKQGQKTACSADLPGTAASACQVALTDAGRGVLATLAHDFRHPFNVIAVAHFNLHAGDAIPQGALDLFLQPTLAFVLPL